MNFTLLILLLLCKSIGEVIAVSDDYVWPRTKRYGDAPTYTENNWFVYKYFGAVNSIGAPKLRPTSRVAVRG